MTPNEKLDALRELISDAQDYLFDLKATNQPATMIAEIEVSIDVAEKQIEQLRSAV